MSRIGKLPVKIDAGVTITVDDSNVVTVKGPKGTLSQQMHPDMQIEQDNGVLTVKRPSDDKAHRALHGLTRSLIHNMVVGVTAGFEKKLEIVGTGYRAHPGHHLRGARSQQDLREGHRQAGRGPGRRQRSRGSASRALQGQGHSL